MTVETRRALRQLQRIRRRAIPYAAKRAQDDVGRELAKPHGLIQRAWDRQFDVRRRTFPARVLRVRRARVQGERVSPTKVVSIAADELLSDQLRGGTRRPRTGRALLLPARRGRRVRRRNQRFVERVGGRDVLFEARKRGGPKVVGVFVRSARIPKRFSLAAPIRAANRLLPRRFDRAVRRELARARARQ